MAGEVPVIAHIIGNVSIVEHKVCKLPDKTCTLLYFLFDFPMQNALRVGEVVFKKIRRGEVSGGC